jgi:enoyl-CoA hydratase
MADEVRYDRRGRIALVTLNRPEYANAQNSAMTYALDAAFARAVDDDEVAVIVLAGAGKHFCGGHDIGTPERDVDKHEGGARPSARVMKKLGATAGLT